MSNIYGECEAHAYNFCAALLDTWATLGWRKNMEVSEVICLVADMMKRQAVNWNVEEEDIE